MGGAHSLSRNANETSGLHEDIIFNILTWLPAEKVLSLRCVCKSWCNIIQSSSFIEAHLHNQISTTSGLITTTFSNVEPLCRITNVIMKIKYLKIMNLPPLNTHLLKVQNDNILVRSFIAPSRLTWATCNGLVLFGGNHSSVGDELFIANPVTKQLLKLPPTVHASNSSFNHLFGLTYVTSTRKYEVLHSFVTKSGVAQWVVGCEVLTLFHQGDFTWRLANQYHTTSVPHFRFEEIRYQEMVFVKDVAHWLVQEKNETEDFMERSDKFVFSLDMTDHDKFYLAKLPSIFETNRLLNIRGALSFLNLRVADLQPSGFEAWIWDTQFEVWVLEDLLKGVWVEQERSIKLEGVRKFEVTPVATVQNGQAIIFRSEFKPSYYFAFDLKFQIICWQLDIPTGSQDMDSEVLPHIDSLVSCRYTSKR